MSALAWIGVGIGVWTIAAVVALGLGAAISYCTARETTQFASPAIMRGAARAHSDAVGKFNPARPLVITSGVPETWVDEAWVDNIAAERRRSGKALNDKLA